MNYRTTANVIDLMMLYTDQLIRQCEEMITACNHQFRDLKENLRHFTPLQACDASAKAFKAIWRSNLPNNTKQFYTGTLNRMHKCMVTQTYSHEYITYEGETHVHDDFDVNSVDAVLTNFRDEVVVIRNQLEGFRTMTKNVYLNGGAYKDIFESLGSCFETIADLKPSQVWIDILEAYIPDMWFSSDVVTMVTYATQLARLVTDICSVDAEKVASIRIPISVHTDHPDGFNLTEYISRHEYEESDVIYPHADGLLTRNDDPYQEHDPSEVFDSHKRIHYLDDINPEVDDYDPMEKMYQYGDRAGEYKPTNNAELVADDFIFDHIDTYSMFDINDIDPHWTVGVDSNGNADDHISDEVSEEDYVYDCE